MKETYSKELSEKQQILLSTYVDKECSFLSRLIAARLIKTNPNAAAFVRSLKRTSDTYRSIVSTKEPSVDLWDRISNRIDAEERSALYLGKRVPVTSDSSLSILTRILPRDALVGGLSGAAIAAMVLVLVTRPTTPGEILPVYTGGSLAAQNTSPLHQASLVDGPKSFSARSSMEVDWMRGSGSLRLIQNPTGKSAIIWVRKRDGISARGSQRLSATPTVRAFNEEGLDVRPLGTSK